MDMNTIKLPISTVFERDSLLTFLDQFDQIIFNITIDVKSWVKENTHADIKVAVEEYFDENILSTSPEELFGKSKSLRKVILSLDTLVITVPVELEKEFRLKLVAWVTKTLNRSIILDIHIDPSLIAGATIESSGFILDHTIRSFFEKRLSERRHHGF